MYKYVLLESIEKEKWVEFLKDHSRNNIFQTYEMSEVFRNTKNLESIGIACIDTKKNILGLVSGFRQKMWRGPFASFGSRIVVWGGPLTKEDLSENEKEKIHRELLFNLSKRYKHKAVYVEIRNLWDTKPEKKWFENAGYVWDDHLEIIIDLTKPEKEIWENMHKNRRKNIKKAEKMNLKIENLADIDYAYKLIEATYNRVKVPLFHKSFFDAIYKILVPKNFAWCIGVRKDSEIVACRIFLTFNEIIYDFYAGTNTLGMTIPANEFLVWKTLIRGKEEGFKKFYFGGAGKPNEPYGPREFKLRFGGEVYNFGRYKKVLSDIKYSVANFGLKLYKNLG